jgi:rubrerythrin
MGLAGALNAADEAPAKNSLTDNLLAARQGELNAKAEYEAFAAKADTEGYKSVAALFRAAAQSETIHLAKHEAALKELKAGVKAEAAKPDVKSTKENLEKMVATKTALNEKDRPASIKVAEGDKNVKVAMSFKGAVAADAEYIKYAKEALANLDAWKAAGKEFFVCEVCSFVMTDPEPEKCPICGAPRSKFTSFK